MKRMICAVMLMSMLVPCVAGAAEKSKSRPVVERTVISEDVAVQGEHHYFVGVMTTRIVDRENGVVCYSVNSLSRNGRTSDGGYPAVAISCTVIVGEPKK